MSAPPLLERAAAFFAARGHGFELKPGRARHWRHRARLAVRRDTAGRLAVGLFQRGTHDVVDIPDCQVHHPAVNEAAQLVRDCLQAGGVEPYNERSGRGQLRYVQLDVVESDAGAGGGRVRLVLVWNAPGAAAAPGLAPFAARLWDGDRRGRHPLLHSILANYQPARDNTILGPAFEQLRGPADDAWARLGGAQVCFDAGSFMQANPEAMGAALEAMKEYVAPGASVVDLHAGVGTIGLSLAASRQLSALRLVEINPAAEAPFWRSWRRLQAAGAFAAAGPPRVEYHAAAAGSDPARWLAGADVAVVDPPRKGLEPQLLRFLCGQGEGEGGGGQVPTPPPRLRRLLYLSCGYNALERDCLALLGSGRWALAAARGFLFFPGADAIETLAVFDRLP